MDQLDTGHQDKHNSMSMASANNIKENGGISLHQGRLKMYTDISTKFDIKKIKKVKIRCPKCYTEVMVTEETKEDLIELLKQNTKSSVKSVVLCHKCSYKYYIHDIIKQIDKTNRFELMDLDEES
jgi:uncharacterized protein with PIN domain